jgi:hypothetical protein
MKAFLLRLWRSISFPDGKREASKLGRSIEK